MFQKGAMVLTNSLRPLSLAALSPHWILTGIRFEYLFPGSARRVLIFFPFGHATFFDVKVQSFFALSQGIGAPIGNVGIPPLLSKKNWGWSAIFHSFL